MSSALWCVVKGRAAAPRDERVHHRRLDLEEAAARRGSRGCSAPAGVRLRKTSRTSGLDDQVDVALAVADLDVGEAVPLLGQRPQRLGERQELASRRGSARRSWCGRACPSTPTKSPRSRELEDARTASPSASFLTWTWISPVRSRSLMKAALPKRAERHDAAGDGVASSVDASSCSAVSAACFAGDVAGEVLRTEPVAEGVGPERAPAAGLLQALLVQLVLLRRFGLVAHGLSEPSPTPERPGWGSSRRGAGR